MSVLVRPHARGGWQVDVRVLLSDGQRFRERRVVRHSKSAAHRWGQERERHFLLSGRPQVKKEVPTLAEFAPRFLDGHTRANRQKPSGVAATESILKWHLVPQLGHRRLDAITNEQVQRLKLALAQRAAKTVNNVLTVLNVLLRKAVEWDVIERMPCAIRLLPIPKPAAGFYDFDEFERLVAMTDGDPQARLVVLLGGEAGLRCGEMMALEWRDVDLHKRQLCVARSDWKGQVTVPKGGRHRFVPLTPRLAQALQVGRHLRGSRVLCDKAGQPVTQKEVQCVMKRLARRANVKPGVHILRHTFCSHLAMRGAAARAIQELAGHEDLKTTQRYMHVSPAAIEDAIRLLGTPGMPSERGNMWATGTTDSAKSNR